MCTEYASSQNRTVFITIMRLRVLFLLILAIGQGQTTDSVTETLAIGNSQLQNVIFGNHLLFQTEVMSVVSCAVECLVSGRCASFTFTPLSSSSSLSLSALSMTGLCRGHSTVMAAADGSVSSPGSALFVFGNVCSFAVLLCRTGIAVDIF